MVVWENHAKTTDAPKRLWKDTSELLLPDGEPSALQDRRYAMFDQRPLSGWIPVDPAQPDSHGRVTKIRANEIAGAFEEAKRLSYLGRCMEASRLLVKILETAQSHHKARRLLNQVTRTMNEDLQACRKSKDKQVANDDDARAFRSRWYTPSMAQEEIIHGEAEAGKEACDVPLRFSGLASPSRLPAGGAAAWDAPWLPCPEATEQPISHPYATVPISAEYLNAPPSRGKDPHIKPQTQPAGQKQFLNSSAADAWTEHVSSGHNNEINMWQRPMTHALQNGKPDSAFQDEAKEDLSGISPGSSPTETSRGEKNLYEIADKSAMQPDYSPRKVEDVQAQIQEIPDFCEIFENDYRHMVRDKAAIKSRAQVLCEGACSRKLNRDSIIANAMERVNQRLIKTRTLASDKLNSGQAKHPIHSVGVGNKKIVSSSTTAEAKKKGLAHAEREIRASANFIARMRNAKSMPLKSKFDPDIWAAGESRVLEIQNPH